jgi:hypothetical protein
MAAATATREAFRFFLDNAGYATPPGRAACALELARAERFADRGPYCVAVDWDADADADRSWIGNFTRDGRDDGRTLWSARVELFDAAGEPVAAASLGGVDLAGDPWDDDYARVVRAELLLEAFTDARRRGGETEPMIESRAAGIGLV